MTSCHWFGDSSATGGGEFKGSVTRGAVGRSVTVGAGGGRSVVDRAGEVVVWPPAEPDAGGQPTVPTTARIKHTTVSTVAAAIVPDFFALGWA
jgi:hypothetical protein